ncbi:MAG: hypothetical protein R2695_08360 [Acidimicrobiales bacterium]
MAAPTAPRPTIPPTPVTAPATSNAAQVPARITVGASIRRSRPAIQSAGRPDPARWWASSDMADANPPTTKNSGITWKIQVIQANDGRRLSALSATMPPSASVVIEMIDQWPKATATMANAR